APGDRTPSLQADLFDANGAVITDANGKAADLSAVTTFDTGLQIGPAFVDQVTSTQSGAVNAGQTVQITVAMSEGVTVDTTNGSPTLALSDGAIVTYDAAASSLADGTLVFDYTVAAADYTTDLTVTAFDTNGAVIADAHGVASDLSSAAGADLALDVN